MTNKNKDDIKLDKDKPLQNLRNDYDRLFKENEKLKKINSVLIQRVDMGIGNHSNAYRSFENAVLVTSKVKQSTLKLRTALEHVEEVNRKLSQSRTQTERLHQRLIDAVESISEAFVLFDNNHKMILTNSQFHAFWEQTDSNLFIVGETSLQEIKELTIKNAINDLDNKNKPSLGTKQNGITQKVFKTTNGQWVQMSERSTSDGGLVIIYTDITAIKVSEIRDKEKALAVKSQILQSTIDNISQGIVLVNVQNQIEAWNDSFIKLAGFKAHELASNKKFDDLMYKNKISINIPPHYIGNIYKTEKTLSDARVIEIRHHNIEQGGYVNTYTDITEQRRTASALTNSYRTMEEKVYDRTKELHTLNVKLEQEITEKEKVETDLIKATRFAENANISKTKFLTAISHDLLQPMNAATLFISAINEMKHEGKMVGLIKSLTFSLKNMESLLNTLVDISKLDSGSVESSPNSFNIDKLLSNLAKECEPKAIKNNIRFNYVKSTAVIFTDSTLLARVLRNLISNAFRYTDKGGILIGCRRHKNHLEIQVIDTGVGISKVNLNDIFIEFKRGEIHNKREDRGLGLGLSIVEKIANVLEDTTIKVQSEENKGSIFSILVPYGKIMPPKALIPKQPLQQHMTFNGYTILVVDNDDSICQGMEELLTLWGVSQVITENTLESVKENSTIKNNKLDLLIVDYHLDNGVIGMDVIDYIQKVHAVPVILITANNTKELLQEVRNKGYYLLNKPIKPLKLKTLMNNIFSA